MSAGRWLLSALVGAGLAGCATHAAVTRGEGATIEQAQVAPTFGGQYRIAVGAIIDKTDPKSEQSLAKQINTVNAGRAPYEQMQTNTVTAGVHDMLVTELFNSNRFIVLERAGLNDVLVEQEFSHSVRAGDKTQIPIGQLEGAELILLGAITAFDAGASGAALPIPVPLNDRGDFGILSLRYKRGYVAMDLRVIDAKTGRVLNTVAVEGRNSRFGMDFTAFVRAGNSRVRLPGVLRYFQNTPVEEALQKMVISAVDVVQKQTGNR